MSARGLKVRPFANVLFPPLSAVACISRNIPAGRPPHPGGPILSTPPSLGSGALFPAPVRPRVCPPGHRQPSRLGPLVFSCPRAAAWLRAGFFSPGFCCPPPDELRPQLHSSVAMSPRREPPSRSSRFIIRVGGLWGPLSAGKTLRGGALAPWAAAVDAAGARA